MKDINEQVSVAIEKLTEFFNEAEYIAQADLDNALSIESKYIRIVLAFAKRKLDEE